MRDAAQVAGYLRDRGDAVFTSFIFFLGTRQAVHSPAEPAWAGTFFHPLVLLVRCIAELFAVLICLAETLDFDRLEVKLMARYLELVGFPKKAKGAGLEAINIYHTSSVASSCDLRT